MTVPKKKMKKFFFPFIAEKVTIKDIENLRIMLKNTGKVNLQFIENQSPYFWGTMLGKGYPNLKATRNRLSKLKVAVLWITPKNNESFLLDYKKFHQELSRLAKKNINILIPTSIQNWSNMCHFIIERPEIFNNINVETTIVK